MPNEQLLILDAIYWVPKKSGENVLGLQIKRHSLSDYLPVGY